MPGSRWIVLALACVPGWHPPRAAGQSANRITILVDAFGTPSEFGERCTCAGVGTVIALPG